MNGGNPAGCKDDKGNPLPTDQRGLPRFGRCDIGAYELQPIGFSTLTVNRSVALPGDPLTYTIVLKNPGATDITNVQVTDTLPVSLSYIDNSLTATSGSSGYQNGVITWTGTVNAGGTVTITYGATVNPTLGFIVNSAVISGGGDSVTRTATVTVDGPICNLTKHAGNPVLAVGAAGSWDDDAVWGPAVLKEGSSYKMWYTGDDGANPSRIGLATSTDGITWTKAAANPVLSPSEALGGQGYQSRQRHLRWRSLQDVVHRARQQRRSPASVTPHPSMGSTGPSTGATLYCMRGIRAVGKTRMWRGLP